jgi:hypothetical protein
MVEEISRGRSPDMTVLSPSEMLGRIRKAARGKTPEQVCDLLWEALEDAWPSLPTWPLWVSVLPQASPQGLRAIDRLYRRRGALVTLSDLRLAIWGYHASDAGYPKHNPVSRVIRRLRRDLALADVPLRIVGRSDGCMMLPGFWTPPWEDPRKPVESKQAKGKNITSNGLNSGGSSSWGLMRSNLIGAWPEIPSTQGRIPSVETPRRVLCGARTRRGTPCKSMSIPGKERCKLHGGKSTGPKTLEGRKRIAQAQAERWRKWRAARELG